MSSPPERAEAAFPAAPRDPDLPSSTRIPPMKRRLAALALAAVASACNPPAPQATPPPTAAPASEPTVIDHFPHYTPDQELRVCVIEGTELKTVTLRYNVVTGDSLTLDGRPFREAYPADARYAENARFYVDNETVTIAGRRYPKYGLPRVLGVDEVERAAEFGGVGVYIEKGTGMPNSVYYLPVRPGCVFQPYQIDYIVGGVRG
jgi:hypothetical protein